MPLLDAMLPTETSTNNRASLQMKIKTAAATAGRTKLV
jgi:hypothetical protein